MDKSDAVTLDKVHAVPKLPVTCEDLITGSRPRGGSTSRMSHCITLGERTSRSC